MLSEIWISIWTISHLSNYYISLSITINHSSNYYISLPLTINHSSNCNFTTFQGTTSAMVVSKQGITKHLPVIRNDNKTAPEKLKSFVSLPKFTFLQVIAIKRKKFSPTSPKNSCLGDCSAIIYFPILFLCKGAGVCYKNNAMLINQLLHSMNLIVKKQLLRF